MITNKQLVEFLSTIGFEELGQNGQTGMIVSLITNPRGKGAGFCFRKGNEEEPIETKNVYELVGQMFCDIAEDTEDGLDRMRKIRKFLRENGKKVSH